MAERLSAFGTQFQIGSTSVIASAVYTTVAGLTDVDGPIQRSEVADASAHDDVSRHRVKRITRVDPGEVRIEGYLDPASATHIGASGLQGLQASGVLRAFKILDVDTGALETAFQGYVTEFHPGPRRHDGLIQFSAVIMATGAVTFTP